MQFLVAPSSFLTWQVFLAKEHSWISWDAGNGEPLSGGRDSSFTVWVLNLCLKLYIMKFHLPLHEEPVPVAVLALIFSVFVLATSAPYQGHKPSVSEVMGNIFCNCLFSLQHESCQRKRLRMCPFWALLLSLSRKWVVTRPNLFSLGTLPSLRLRGVVMRTDIDAEWVCSSQRLSQWQPELLPSLDCPGAKRCVCT